MAVTPSSRTDEGSARVVSLALLIARAGSKDSLRWWDDEALTEAGRFVLAKIFSRNAALAGVRLALLAARARHAGVLTAAGRGSERTLFDLVGDTVDASALAPALHEPIQSVDQLRSRVLALVPDAAAVATDAPDANGLLDVSDLATRHGPLASFAAGYLGGGIARAVFPFVR